MDTQFQYIIEAGVQHAKARRSVLWAEEFARRIVSSTPLSVSESDISEQIILEAARVGVVIYVAGQQNALNESGCSA